MGKVSGKARKTLSLIDMTSSERLTRFKFFFDGTAYLAKIYRTQLFESFGPVLSESLAVMGVANVGTLPSTVLNVRHPNRLMEL